MRESARWPDCNHSGELPPTQGWENVLHFVIGRSRLALLGATLAFVGCSGTAVTQTPFARVAADTASVFSAAAQTIRFVHSAQLTVEYGQGAMVNFSEQVRGVASELPTLEGAPEPPAAADLSVLVAAAAADLEAACLREGCDWTAQVERIEQAKRALLEAVQ
jgi:hypothetical protein